VAANLPRLIWGSFMTATFLLAAAGMTLVALGFSAIPLIRHQFSARRRIGGIRGELRTLMTARTAGALDLETYAAQRAVLGEALLSRLEIEPKHSASMRYSAIAVAVLLPLAAFGLYRWRGSPATFQAHASAPGTAAPLADHGIDIQAAISKLAAKLREHPDDAEGWALLGRTYKATEHYPEARDAFKHAVAAAPGDAGFQREYAAAETPNDARSVEPEQCPTPGLNAADGASASMDAECTASPVSANGTTGITVKVSLDPKLKDKVRPSDTLFVFAKAAQGPAMPLAIARLSAGQLPASVTLSDSMSMLPNVTLSQFSQIVLGARISKSGNAVPQKGDYQTISSALANTGVEPIKLTIDRTIE
jgi:cytochrome c-type biogenesis protein CcmH